MAAQNRRLAGEVERLLEEVVTLTRLLREAEAARPVPLRERLQRAFRRLWSPPAKK